MQMLYRRTTAAEVIELERDPDRAGHLVADGPPPRMLELGRAWHGIHFLLNGSAWGGDGPAFDAVLGGTALGDPSSYEPVRLLVPDAVADVARHLDRTGPAELTPRFTHRALQRAEVYPEAAWSEPDALTAFLLPAYARLAAFFAAAAAERDAVLITLDRT